MAHIKLTYTLSNMKRRTDVAIIDTRATGNSWGNGSSAALDIIRAMEAPKTPAAEPPKRFARKSPISPSTESVDDKKRRHKRLRKR